MRIKHEVRAPQFDQFEDKAEEILETKKDKLIKRAVPFVVGVVCGVVAVKMFGGSSTITINNYTQAIED